MTPIPPQTERAGVLGAVRNGAATLLTIGRTRLELLGNELAEQKLRIAHATAFLLIAAFSLVIALLVAVALLVAIFWESRVLVLASATLVFLLLGIYALVSARKAIARPDDPDQLFASSLAELEEDVRQLKEVAKS